jgi:uncharacterized protein (TIGR03435 family)
MAVHFCEKLMGWKTIRAMTIVGTLCMVTGSLEANRTGQQPPSGSPDLAFDAVAIKPGQPEPRLGLQVRRGGLLELINMPMIMLIERAYGLKPYQIVGGPDWIRQEQFAVRARASGDPTTAQINAMIRSMRAERFQLLVHAEQRPLPVYLLTRARQDGRLGPNLRPRNPPCVNGAVIGERAGDPIRCGPGPTGGSSMVAYGVTMATFADLLDGYWLNMPVVDRTGLSGQYDIRLTNVENQWGPKGPDVDVRTTDAVGPAIAVQEQLGLKLELGRAPRDVLVIDRVQRPITE